MQACDSSEKDDNGITPIDKSCMLLFNLSINPVDVCVDHCLGLLLLKYGKYSPDLAKYAVGKMLQRC